MNHTTHGVKINHNLMTTFFEIFIVEKKKKKFNLRFTLDLNSESQFSDYWLRIHYSYSTPKKKQVGKKKIMCKLNPPSPLKQRREFSNVEDNFLQGLQRGCGEHKLLIFSRKSIPILSAQCLSWQNSYWKAKRWKTYAFCSLKYNQYQQR